MKQKLKRVIDLVNMLNYNTKQYDLGKPLITDDLSFPHCFQQLLSFHSRLPSSLFNPYGPFKRRNPFFRNQINHQPVFPLVYQSVGIGQRRMIRHPVIG